MTSFVDRVASEAASVRPLRWVLAALAAVFYVIGFAVGLLVVAFKFAIGAVRVGMADVAARFAPVADDGGGDL